MNVEMKFLLILIAVVCLSACESNQVAPPAVSVSKTVQPADAKTMPPIDESDLSWRLVDGRSERLKDYAGRAVILDFWATYCPPCEAGIPHFVELSNRYKNDLQIVGLHVGGADDKPNVPAFVTKYKMTYKLGYPTQELSNFYLQNDDRIPQTFVFDRTGKLVKQFVGFDDQTKAEIDAAVQKAMQ